jgi:molybdopterin-containing oxidoreductase family iron-sulfur binding subunit
VNDSEGHKKLSADEFREDLPSRKPMERANGFEAPRRDFLKCPGLQHRSHLGRQLRNSERPFPTSTSQRTSSRASELLRHYFFDGGDAIPAVAKVRDGRPIKIEGNELSSYEWRHHCRMQASGWASIRAFVFLWQMAKR